MSTNISDLPEPTATLVPPVQATLPPRDIPQNTNAHVIDTQSIPNHVQYRQAPPPQVLYHAPQDVPHQDLKLNDDIKIPILLMALYLSLVG